MSKTIEELKIVREKIEADLIATLENFEERFGCSVDTIDITKIKAPDGSQDRLLNVRLNIKI